MNFFARIKDVLTQPTRFFSEEFPRLKMSDALVFAILTSWLGSLLGSFHRLISGSNLADQIASLGGAFGQDPKLKEVWGLISDSVSTQNLPFWALELAVVSLTPFKTVLLVTFAAASIWMGVAILVPKRAGIDSTGFSNQFKICCFTTGAGGLCQGFFGFAPDMLATLITMIVTISLLVVAVRVRYQVSTLRSIAIYFLPSVIFALFMGFLVVLGIILVGAIVGSTIL